MPRYQSRLAFSALALGLIAALLACAALVVARGVPTAAAQAPAYAPETRSFTITAVPYLTNELADTYDYLKTDFAQGGVLDGKEVYGFYPSSLTVYQGDTVNLTLVNPEDDPHTFTLPDFDTNVNMEAQSVEKGSFVASRVGTFTFLCAESEHAPYMWGQLTVLPDSDAAQQ